MKKSIGIHFYINIVNLNDISEEEEKTTKEVRHTIRALDTFFSSIEVYGKKHYNESFVVEKITGSRLHMYVVNDDIAKAFDIVAAVSIYAYRLTGWFHENIAKYKTLLPFKIQVGACYGKFYEFEFNHAEDEELTTIGFAPNYAAKLQNTAPNMHLRVSENLYEAIKDNQRNEFRRVELSEIKKYEQQCCYDVPLEKLVVKYNYAKDLQYATQIASHINLNEMRFNNVNKQLSYRTLSKAECKKLYGIPLFADVRDFTSQFDANDANLEEMTHKTQNILTTMYDIVSQCKGTHVQFQGDREMALFHDYSTYECVQDAVVAGLRIIDAVKSFGVSVGVGQSYGKMFAAKIGARSEKDNILIGRTVDIADRNEGNLANKNQLVITDAIYQKLRVVNNSFSSLFVRIDKNTFYTELGYKEFLNSQAKAQLQKSNRQKDYNGAWHR